MPHADVLHPGTGKLRVGLAEKLNNEEKIDLPTRVTNVMITTGQAY